MPHVEVAVTNTRKDDEEVKHVSKTALWRAVKRHGALPPGYLENGYQPK